MGGWAGRRRLQFSAVVRCFFGCGSVVDCSLPVAKSHYKSKEARQNRAFFTWTTHHELKQTREQGDFESVRRTDQQAVNAE